MMFSQMSRVSQNGLDRLFRFLFEVPLLFTKVAPLIINCSQVMDLDSKILIDALRIIVFVERCLSGQYRPLGLGLSFLLTCQRRF